MVDIVVENVIWKKGEKGIQKFIIFDSDGVTRRNGTGKTYDFSFWKSRGTVVKGTGALVATNESQGEYSYIVLAANTDTIENYIGEIIENILTDKLRSNTFKVDVEESSDLS